MRTLVLLLLTVGFWAFTAGNSAFALDGACCLSDGSCSDTNLAGCVIGSGDYLGEGTTCATSNCMGACCLVEESCTEETRDDCAIATGTFQGAGTTCELYCAAKLPSTFAYQGQLKQAGVPLTGSADLTFSLWTSAVGGDQVGDTLIKDNVLVEGGLLSASLDFGTTVFNGNARWLEVQVRSPHDMTDTEPLTTLTPRQLITATPHSISTRGLHVTDEGRVGIGTTAPEATLDIRAEKASLFVDSSDSLFGTLLQLKSSRPNPGLLGIISFVASSLSDPGAAIIVSASGAMQFGAGSKGLMTLKETGNFGIGTSEPIEALHVVHDQTVDAFGGILVENINPAQDHSSVYIDLKNNHPAANNSYRLQNVGNVPGREGNFEIWDRGAGAGRFTIDSTGEVGIGTTQPTSLLHVNGDANIEKFGGVISGGVVTVGKSTRPQTLLDGGALQVRQPGGGPYTMVLNPHGGDLVLGPGDFYTGGDIITDAGNVGIGTLNPSARLSVRDLNGETGIEVYTEGYGTALSVIGDSIFDGDIEITPTTKYLMLNRVDFVRFNNTLWAPVNLPDGVTITQLRAYVVGTFQGWTNIQLLADPATCELCQAVELAAVSSFGDAQQYYAASNLNIVVTNENTAIYVHMTSGVDFGGTVNPTITSVRIRYVITHLP